ncbi:ion transporter [Sciscionella sediminilitoris]|uniref:ion transporter n=1 Tax=Sciscionella sediminilitoris TaxID=1445613 RepID=UPI000562EC48|nr:ion transporter [Sciscionella sp. SE31]
MSARKNINTIDWLMLALAIISVGLLIYAIFYSNNPETEHWIFVADTSICGLFLLEFLWRWHKHGWEKWFPLRNWYEILGMIPVAHPALRGFRLIRVVVVLMRLGRAADRAFGEQFTQRLIERLSAPIVRAIKKPITIAVLDEVVKVLETGNYPQNLARSLEENRTELRTIVAEKLREDPQAGRLRRLPFHDEVVQGVIDTAFRIVLEVLGDPRIDEFFADVVKENREQIRRAVQLGLHEQEDEDAEQELPVKTQHRVLEEEQHHGPSVTIKEGHRAP